MSHLTTIKVQVKDLDALRAACARLGFEWREGQRTYRWYNTWVGDAPLPEGITAEDLGKCDHAISVPGAAYEVGIVDQGGQYALLYDFWGPGGLGRALGANAERLVQAYAVEAATAEAQRHGYSIWEEALENGGVRLYVQTGG